MDTLTLITVAYSFITTGFCLGFVTCAVLCGPRRIREQRQAVPE